MFAKYYQSELTYLREMGRAFAQKHPSTAGMLADRGADPDVERLLEGFAFIAAQIRERIDDEVPEVVDNLTGLLLPHYLRPIPAAAIVEFKPNLNALRGKLEIEKHSPLAAKPVDGTACVFQTTQSVDVLPLSVVDARLDASAVGRPKIKIELETSEAGRPLVSQAGRLRFHLHGSLALASTLMLWLSRHCAAITVTSGDSELSLRPDSLRFESMAPKNSLLQWPENAPEAFRCVQEYFSLPAKFLFFELPGLDGLELKEDRFFLEFEFDHPPQLTDRLSGDAFRLHCTPVVNLFSTAADPIQYDPTVQEHLVRAAGSKPGHAEVYAVESVVGFQPGQRQREVFPPFFAFEGQRENSASAYYTLNRRPSPLDDGMDCYLSLMSPSDQAASFGVKTLSLELSCTNRILPTELKIGDISQRCKGSPTTVDFENITPVAPPSRVPRGKDLHWKLLSHLSLSRKGLSEVESLRDILALYNFHLESHPPLGRANQLKIQSIRQVRTESVTRLMGGAPVRGALTTIELGEDGFMSQGEAWLFGSVLNELFAEHATLNSFSELRIQLHPSGVEYSWSARNGRQKII